MWDDRDSPGLIITAPSFCQLREGLYAGHWGFRYCAEKNDWVALEDDAFMATGQLLATVRHVGHGNHQTCLVQELEHIWQYEIGIRLHSEDTNANIHSQLISRGNSNLLVTQLEVWALTLGEAGCVSGLLALTLLILLVLRRFR